MSYRDTSKYSKNQINRAGEKLATTIDDEENLSIVNEFRYSHEFITKELLRLVSAHDLVVYSSRRLKRTKAIVHKIQRSKKNRNSTKLHRMQDIWWCRCVFNEIKDIKLFIDGFIWQIEWFKLIELDNYIDKNKENVWPKKDWYRWIHAIYEYVWIKNEYHWLKIELQLRTKLQHYRATAVEIIDLMNQSKLKFWWGEQKYKDFFRWSSVIFENAEWYKTPNRKKAVKKIKEILKKENIIDILENRVISYDFVSWFQDKVLNKNYWNKNIQWDMILEITKEGGNIRVKVHHNKPLEELKKIYLELEKGSFSENKEVVYLSSDEIENTYPNYVWDASNFIQHLSSLL